MKEFATFFMYGIWVFGALLIWPMMKFMIKVPVERLRILKWLFWLQVFWLMASYAAIQYYRLAGYEDWLHSLILPYIVGAVSWVAVLAALLEMGLRNKKKVIEG